MDRRAFAAMLGAMGLGSVRALRAAPEGVAMGGGNGGTNDPEVLQLSRNGWMPNNEHLPVLLYRDVMQAQGNDAASRSSRSLSEMDGPRSGETASTAFTITIRRRMRCSASPAVQRG